jgi:selenocysteine lyase/cysteine desulfurase
MLFSKDEFIGMGDTVHLACGGQPPLLKNHRQAFEDFAVDKSRGMAGYERHWEVGCEVKSLLAGMTELEADDFALLGNASEGIARVVSSFDWQQGDNTVVSSLDYTSGKFSLARLQQAGVEFRSVRPTGYFIDIDALISACDERTRLVYISQVNAHTGQQVDLESLSNALRQRGIALLVDASHALGVVPVDGRHCDFLVSSTYKFLLAPHMGIFAWNQRSFPDFEPLAVGWHSAVQGANPESFDLVSAGRRCEIGNSNHLDVYLLLASLRFLSTVSATSLNHHVARLSEILYSGLQDSGLQILTPENPAQRGPNISFLHPDPRNFVDQAGRENILLWGEAGRVRASLHGFVTKADVQIFLEWVSANIGRLEVLE